MCKDTGDVKLRKEVYRAGYDDVIFPNYDSAMEKYRKSIEQILKSKSEDDSKVESEA